MKLFSDKSQRQIHLALEPSELNKLIYEELKNNGYEFEQSEIELRYEFVEEGSPSYKTNKLKCLIKITKLL